MTVRIKLNKETDITWPYKLDDPTNHQNEFFPSIRDIYKTNNPKLHISNQSVGKVTLFCRESGLYLIRDYLGNVVYIQVYSEFESEPVPLPKPEPPIYPPITTTSKRITSNNKERITTDNLFRVSVIN